MVLFRLLFLAALVMAVFWVWRRIQRHRSSPSPSAPPPSSQTMVRCQHCGLYLPQPQAIAVNQHWYCCKEHAAHDSKQP